MRSSSMPAASSQPMGTHHRRCLCWQAERQVEPIPCGQSTQARSTWARSAHRSRGLRGQVKANEQEEDEKGMRKGNEEEEEEEYESPGTGQHKTERRVYFGEATLDYGSDNRATSFAGHLQLVSMGRATDTASLGRHCGDDLEGEQIGTPPEGRRSFRKCNKLICDLHATPWLLMPTGGLQGRSTIFSSSTSSCCPHRKLANDCFSATQPNATLNGQESSGSVWPGSGFSNSNWPLNCLIQFRLLLFQLLSLQLPPLLVGGGGRQLARHLLNSNSRHLLINQSKMALTAAEMVPLEQFDGPGGDLFR